MCQQALAELKMAIKAAREHKLQINVTINMDGIRLRDEKTGVCKNFLWHFFQLVKKLLKMPS